MHAACRHTFGPQVLRPLQIIHLFERLGLLLGELLLIVVLARPRYPVQKNTPLLCVSEIIDDGCDDEDNTGGAQH
jgi:hypothetical protein